MSKNVSRSARRALARNGGIGAVVAFNMSSPKPGTSRGTKLSGAFDTTRTKGPRAHDPAGNTFTAHYEAGSRPNYRHDERHLAYQAKLSAAFEAAIAAHRRKAGRSI